MLRNSRSLRKALSGSLDLLACRSRDLRRVALLAADQIYQTHSSSDDPRCTPEHFLSGPHSGKLRLASHRPGGRLAEGGSKGDTTPFRHSTLCASKRGSPQPNHGRTGGLIHQTLSECASIPAAAPIWAA